MDADKQGFLRSTRSLIQTIGRAARNASGKVIMYADSISDSMKEAIDETRRRREIQEAYNKEHNITPKTIIKEIPETIKFNDDIVTEDHKITKEERLNIISNVEAEMKKAAEELDFERAMELRDILFELQGENNV